MHPPPHIYTHTLKTDVNEWEIVQANDAAHQICKSGSLPIWQQKMEIPFCLQPLWTHIFQFHKEMFRIHLLFLNLSQKYKNKIMFCFFSRGHSECLNFCLKMSLKQRIFLSFHLEKKCALLCSLWSFLLTYSLHTWNKKRKITEFCHFCLDNNTRTPSRLYFCLTLHFAKEYSIQMMMSMAPILYAFISLGNS